MHNSRSMSWLGPALFAALAVSLTSSAGGGQISFVPQKAPVLDLPLTRSLYDAEQRALTDGVETSVLQAEFALQGLHLNDAGLMHVEIVGPPGSPAVSEDFVESFGGTNRTRWRHRGSLLLPISEMSNIARALPDGYLLLPPDISQSTEVQGEGPAVTNSFSYYYNGAGGDGMKIAIIDGGFSGLTAARNNGDGPPTYVGVKYDDDPFESGGTHGTGCTEAAFDHCPQASWRLYRHIDLTTFADAVENAVDNDVDIISASISWFNLGWNDNSGDACASANHASDNGILFLTASGNYAERHWQGDFNPGYGSEDWHDWTPGDEDNSIIISSGDELRSFLQWNGSPDDPDYDLYLFDGAGNELASGTEVLTYDKISWTNNTGSDKTVYLAVYRASGGVTDFELFASLGRSMQHSVAWSSTTSPSNATGDNVVSVGAVHWEDYDSPNGTGGIVASYSSQGPSNDGMLLPDICGPTSTTGFTYPGGFGGTSCATPNIAGALCAFWSADRLLGTHAPYWLISKQAALWRDWGAAGNDNIYGHGGGILIDYVPNTLWVARDYGNFFDYRSFPFYRVQSAHNAATEGGRLLIFPGGDYPEGVTLTKALTVETVEYPAVLGDE
ncbi:S8 family serine peptidase [Candidatus Eisenbacteria bacterium]|uniref:S8 family serine peptidase n=1 Tax=Eiseniibacteriota bacterium TaxID=2212470 RepID=A0ABV6YJ38_UNCEI